MITDMKKMIKKLFELYCCKTITQSCATMKYLVYFQQFNDVSYGMENLEITRFLQAFNRCSGDDIRLTHLLLRDLL